MVVRTKLGGGFKSASGFGRTMQPEAIRKLASYIFVDRALVLKLANTGLDGGRVDELRAILLLNQNPGIDIGSPLDAYDAVVMEMANFIVEDNMHLVEEEIRKAQADALGIGFPEEISDTIEEEVTDVETPEQRIARQTGVEPGEIVIPEKQRVVSKKGVVSFRSKSVSWRKRGQKQLSAQEQFIVSRAGQPAADTQKEYVQRFKVYRSKQSILTKQRRLVKRKALSEEEGKRAEESGGGMSPQ